MKAATIYLLVMGVLLTGCSGRTLIGSGVVAGEDYDLDDFSSVDVCCGMELFIQTGAPEAIHIEAEDNILEALEVRLNGDTLVVDFGMIIGFLDVQETRPIQVFVTLPELTGIEVSGGGALSAQDIQGERLSLNLSGGSRAYLEGISVSDFLIESSGGGTYEIRSLQAESLALDASGGGKITLYGTVSDLTATLSGGSELDGDGLLSHNAVLDISGGGRSSLSVSDTLRVDLSGGSRLDYFGSPQIDRSDISSASELVGHSSP
ncbi:MAG: DUF2807 domain-containing protein [Anaerolineales bacterium]|nr:DUF2807 domain-containing protein [Anaerolineales bacterium]